MIHLRRSENRDGWLQHPHTAELNLKAREQAKAKLLALRAAARRSPDPDVRWAMSELQAAEDTVALLQETGDAEQE